MIPNRSCARRRSGQSHEPEARAVSPNAFRTPRWRVGLVWLGQRLALQLRPTGATVLSASCGAIVTTRPIKPRRVSSQRAESRVSSRLRVDSGEISRSRCEPSGGKPCVCVHRGGPRAFWLWGCRQRLRSLSHRPRRRRMRRIHRKLSMTRSTPAAGSASRFCFHN